MTFRGLGLVCKKVLVTIVLIFIATACVEESNYQGQGNAKVLYSSFAHKLIRVEDNGAGVVCWAWQAADGGGVSCLPVEQTELIR